MKKCYLYLTFLLVVTGSLYTQDTPVNNDELGVIKITKSGFFLRDTLIIKYNKFDKSIQSVRDNGKNIPENKFYKYEKQIQEVLEHTKLEDILVEIDEMDDLLKRTDIHDTLKLAELHRIKEYLDAMNFDLADTYLDIYSIYEDELIFKQFRIMVLEQMDLKDLPFELETSNKECKVDHNLLSKGECSELMKLYEVMFDRSLDKNESVTIQF